MGGGQGQAILVWLSHSYLSLSLGEVPTWLKYCWLPYAPVICIHCSPTYGEGWDNDFTYQSLGISPALWGQADNNNPALSSRVKFLNVIIPALRGQSKSNYPAPQPTYSMAIPVGWGLWIQMIGALSLNQWQAYKYSYLPTLPIFFTSS